jgi:DNA repair exonuclease SbcCD ATPase subunit
VRLKRIEARNWRQHQKIDLKFKPGITGIFGANGRGKSNLIEAIGFNLTGEWGGGLTKEGNIYDQMSEGEKAYVLCDWEHDGTNITITRNLPDKQSLIVGDRNIKSAAEIALYVTELLGMSTRLIQELVFVKQGDKMFDFLTAKPEERAKSYAHLCGTEDLEKLWKLIGEQISSDQHLASTVVDNTESMQNQLTELNMRLGQLGDQHKQARRGLLKKKEGTFYKEVVKSWRRWEHLQEEIKRFNSRLEKKRPKIDKSATCLSKLQAKAKTLRERFEKRAAKAKRYERIKDRLKESGDRRRRIDELKAIVNRKPPEQPKEPKDFEPPALLRPKIKELRDKLAEARRILSVFAEKGVVECPTCRTPVTKLDDHLAEMKAYAIDHAKEPEELQAKLTVCEAYDKKKFEWDRAMVKFDTTTSMAQDELNELDKPENPLETPEDLHAWLESYDKLRLDVATAEKNASEYEKKHVVKQESIRIWEGAREEHVAECKKIASNFSAEAARQAEERLQKHRQAMALVNQISPQIDSTSEDIKRVTFNLSEIALAKERSAAGNKWIVDLNAWREVVHRDNLQRIITQSFLEELVDQINEKLEAFDGPFKVSPGDALTMDVHKPNGSKTSSLVLSGGEKVVLAIAYRMAVNPGEMLVLDEPTTGLDTHNLGCLTEVLDNLRGLTKKQGRQIIMVTHDERLERVFDRVIRL